MLTRRTSTCYVDYFDVLIFVEYVRVVGLFLLAFLRFANSTSRWNQRSRTVEKLWKGCWKTIWHGISPVTGAHRIIWTVDAGKLRNHERQAVSPSFELPLASLATSRLVIFPKANADGKGSASFKKSGGWGSVYLKCEASGGSVSFMLSVSDGTMDYVRSPRGPVTHNFADHSTCGLPRDQEQWDFSKAVNHATQTFAVYLDILPSGGF